ncbi:MAG: DUF2271 domain-containing protein [Treponema sp.]|nr:DUF2271 domain-containing protein [Treponema sp.]
MKQAFFLLLLAAFALAHMAAQQAQQAAAEVSLTFTRQGGIASNQFAVWVEDAQGRYVRTLYATRWTANGGWNRRPTSIPIWVDRSGLSGKPRAQIDAVSGVTPRTGTVTHVWDGTDSSGSTVPPGDYVIYVEGTLRWENQVLHRAPITIGQGPRQAQVSVEFSGPSTAERGMISGVSARALR